MARPYAAGDLSRAQRSRGPADFLFQQIASLVICEKPPANPGLSGILEQLDESPGHNQLSPFAF